MGRGVQPQAGEPVTEGWQHEVDDEAHRIMEDVLHSSKAHFNSANLWQRMHYYIGIPATLLAAFGGSQIVQGTPQALWGWAAVLGGALMAILTFLDTQDHARTHHRAGAAFKQLHTELRMFVNLEVGTMKPGDAVVRLHEFRERRDTLNQDSRPICWWSYFRAKRGIDKGEADYVVDRDPEEGPV